MRVYLIMPILAIALSGAVTVSSDNPNDDIFGPFHNGYATTCRHTDRDMMRIVSVHYLDEESHVPCEVRYHKPTEHPEAGHRVLWHAHRTEGYCERKAKLLVKRLEGWGWQCGAPVWYEDTGARGNAHSSDESSSASGDTDNRGDTESGDSATAPTVGDCNRYGGYYCD